MRTSALTVATSVICVLPMFAKTNAIIEVKLFKTWVIPNERYTFVNLAIKNTGADPIRLVRDVVEFEGDQLTTRLLNDTSNKESNPIRDSSFQKITWANGFFELPQEETQVYEGRKLHIEVPFSGKKFVVSLYLGKGFWLDSEPLTVNGVIPDAEEHLATVTDGRNLHMPKELVAITYKNERWLYSKVGSYYPAFPLSLKNKIRIEPHDGFALYKIWDGDKSMIYDIKKSLLLDGPDENNVFGKWTRERKQKAEADNAEVRRKKAEGK